MSLRAAAGIALTAATACYPLALWWALRNGMAGAVLWAMAGIMLLRLVICGVRQSPAALFLLIVMSAAAAAFTLSGSALPAKLYPVFVSLSLLALFGLSLTGEKCAVQRLAELRVPEEQRTDFFRLYCRRVTEAWCVFFVLNGSVALSTCFMSDRAWALWNGLISYILIGCMFACEFAVRIWLRRRERI